jgi:large subunit ribosomal protein L28
MSRRCAVTGKGVLSGNNVSHANNKTRRRFMPNLQETSLFSESLGRMIKVRVSTNGLRTIEHRGGLDAYLISCTNAELKSDMRRVRKQVEKHLATRAA